MARLLVCPITSVYPSAGDLAAASTPMLPPAPGLLSTTTVHLFMSVSLLATWRARMSVPPAGGKGTTSLIGLVGYCWAAAAVANAAAARARQRRVERMTPPGVMCSWSHSRVAIYSGLFAFFL